MSESLSRLDEEMATSDIARVRDRKMESPVDETSRRTLSHYQDRADAFWEGTRDHDVTQNIEASRWFFEDATGTAILLAATVQDNFKMACAAAVEAGGKLGEQVMQNGLDLARFEDGPVKVVGGVQYARIKVCYRWFGGDGVKQFIQAYTLAPELSL